MTKKQVKDWIELKRKEAIDIACVKLEREQDQEVAEYLEGVKAEEFIREVVNRVEGLMAFVEDYKKFLCDRDSSLSVKGGYSYNKLNYCLKEYLNRPVPNLVCYFMDNEVGFDCSSLLRRHRGQVSDLIEGINTNYTNVTVNAMSYKNAKEAVNYLEGLGFDVSELREEKEVTALTVPVDTSFLKLP